MMPEHDPQPAGRTEPEDARGDEPCPPGAAGPGEDGVVHMSDHRSPAPPDRDDDDTVVDLRRGDGVRDGEVAHGAGIGSPDEVVGHAPGVERRSPEVAAAPAVASSTPVASPEPPAVPPPTSLLSHRVLRTVGPALVVLVVASLLAGVAVLRSGSAQRDAEEWRRVADAEVAGAAAVDDVWRGVLAAVAAGVGQSVEPVDRLPELLGVAAERSEVRAPDGSARTELDAAARERQAVVADVRAALERSDGEPVELGNELTSLSDSRDRSVEASQAAVERAREQAELAAQDATAAGALALLVLLLGLVGAGAAAELSRRRLRWGLDRPVQALRDDVASVGDERAGDVSTATTSPGFPELGWLADELRRRLRFDRSRVGQLRRRAEWGEQSRRIFEALDLAEDEASTYSVLERALAGLGEDRPVELLLAERGSTSLRRVASNPAVAAPGCPVDTTVACVALRRGQVSVFDSSESINACPKLRDRPSGACAAACVPVTVAGRPVGVLHMTGPDQAPPPADTVEQLVGLATQTGTRFSALRTLESSRQEASTDGLTGLPNRRTLEAQMAELFERDTPFVTVLADLDRFKLLNDNFGHEVGDRALQLFAAVLRDNVRGNDVVARLGGEEFVLVYPNMSVEISLEAIGRVRAALSRALESSTVPPFTCSFGIAHSTVGHDGDSVLRIADAGMLQAKDQGGDQAVVADADLAAVIFAEDAPLRSRRDPR